MSKRNFMRLAVLVAVVAGVLASAPAAFAQLPANDDVDSATTVTEPLPYQDIIDTSEATGAETDPGCASEPGDPNNPTVWYSYTPSEGGFVQADTFGSDYDTTLSAYVDDGGEQIQIDCNDDAFDLQSAITIEVFAGEPVLFMVGACCGQAGGNLVFNVAVPPPPLEFDLQVDEIGSVVPRDGVATITGTVNCSAPSQVDMFARLQQRSGRVIISGFGFDFFECDGETPFALTIVGENGLFTGGKAHVVLDAFAFGPGGFGEAFVDQDVRLRGRRH